MTDKYVNNLIQSGASPHLLAKLSTFPPKPVAIPEDVPVQDDTHGNADEPAPARPTKRGRPRKRS